MAETVAFFATGCSFLDIAEVVDRSVAQVSKEIYDTWCEDYYIGCVDNIAKLAFDGYLVREQGLDEDGVEPGEVIVLEEYMEGVPQESRAWHVRRTRRVEDMEVTTFQLYWHCSLLYW